MESDAKRPRRQGRDAAPGMAACIPGLPAPAAACTAQDIFNLPLTEDYLVVDTRSAEAYAAAHLPTARSFPTPAAHAAAAGIQLEVHAAAWVAAAMKECEPEQKSQAAILGDPSAKENRAVLLAVTIAIAEHPLFQRGGRLRSLRVCEEGHAAVAVEYPFLPGKEWDALPAAYPSEVQPGLFLGSAISARSRQVFEDLGIMAVVNAAEELPNFHEGDEAMPRICYLKLAMADDPLQELEAGLEKALPFIAAALQEGQTVLVHCQMGVSRSVSVVLAHLMSMLGCGYDAALAVVRRARPNARPNEGFEAELRALEGRLIYGPK